MPLADQQAIMHAMSFGLHHSISALIRSSIRPFHTCMGSLPMINDFGPMRRTKMSAPRPLSILPHGDRIGSLAPILKVDARPPHTRNPGLAGDPAAEPAAGDAASDVVRLSAAEERSSVDQAHRDGARRIAADGRPTRRYPVRGRQYQPPPQTPAVGGRAGAMTQAETPRTKTAAAAVNWRSDRTLRGRPT